MMAPEDNKSTSKEVIEEGITKETELNDTMELNLDLEEFSRVLEERVDELFQPTDYEKKEDHSDTNTKGETVGDRKPPPPPEKPTSEASLTQLIEQLHMAYLAIEWEFSADNIRELEKVLITIKNNIELNEQALALYEILVSMLELFSEDEKYVNYASMALLKDSLHGFTRIVQKNGALKREEVELVKSLVVRFRQFRGKLEEEEPETSVVQADTKEKLMEYIGQQDITDVETTPRDIEQIPDKEKEYELPKEIKEFISYLRSISRGIEKNTGALSRLRMALAKKPALKPLMEYLLRLERNYTEYVRRLGVLEEEVEKIFGPFVRGIPVERGVVEGPDSKEKELLPDVGQAKPDIYEGDVIPEAFRNVLLAQIMGLYYFLPAERVVRVAHASRKKMEQIIRRGYATLNDFKPILRSVRSYVLEPWAQLPTEELKRMRFRPFDVGAFFGIGNTFKSGGGDAILLTFDHGNFIIFADVLLSKGPMMVEKFKISNDKPGIVGLAWAGNRKDVPIISEDLFK